MTIQAVSPAIAPQNPAQPGPQMTTEILGPPQIFQKVIPFSKSTSRSQHAGVFVEGKPVVGVACLL